ncbi:MAG: penicillin-binding protein 2 [Patescibacteria group bacterium]|jgi:cell division protein FtsI/penicillin-binding protein 2
MNSQNKLINRFKVISVLAVIMVAVILWRMFEKQILQHSEYIALAEGQQRFETTDIAQRGRIYVHDSIGGEDSLYPLAFDVKSFSLWVVPKQVIDKEKTADELSALVGVDSKTIFDEINNDKLYVPPIKKGMSYELSDQIKAKKFSGVFIMPEYSRYYPELTLASQLLGFVNAEGKGNYGFEGHYDKELQGTSGQTIGEKDTLGRVINLLEQKDPKDGTSYVLTIDRSVQYYVERTLRESLTKYQADSGTIIIMDVKTGGIVAMANEPGYDPNQYRIVAKDNSNIFMNPAISGLYEPGSIMKPITMAGALDSGAVTPDTTETFGSEVEIGGYTIHTAEGKAFGTENMSQIIQNSDNIGMAWVSEKEGKDNIYKYLNEFNILNKTNIDLDGEVEGSVPPFKQWQDINRATIAFGQGVSVTPLEMVCAYTAIANKGKYIYPHVVDKILNSDGTETQIQKTEGKQVVKTETAAQVTEMLKSVFATGHDQKAAIPGVEIAVKTGTAQVPKPEGGYEEGIFNHSFMGFAPANDPRFVMLVKLDKPKAATYAESTSAPVWGQIGNFLVNYYYKLVPNKPSN